MSDEPAMPKLGDSLDTDTFEQILEMDDDEQEREFSRSIVYGFFDQAHETFGEFDQKLKEQNLERLSELGHYLKGSSATLGLSKIRDICEKIQHLGKSMDETGSRPQGEAACLKSISSELAKLKKEYTHIEGPLMDFYGHKRPD